MRLRRLLFGITVLSISVLTTTLDTQAKEQSRFQRGQSARSNSNSIMPKARLRRAATQAGSQVHAFSLSKSKLEKLVKSAIRRCGCASSAEEAEFSTSCFTNCLARYVGWQTALACATTCGANPVGCTICVGVHEWIVLACVQYCVWRNILSVADGPVATNRGRPSVKRPAKYLMKLPVVASAS